MRASLDISQYDLPVGALIDIDRLAGAADARSQQVTQLRELMRKIRLLQKEWVNGLERLYDEANRNGWSAPLLIELAAQLMEKQRAALESFHPKLEAVRRYAAEFASRPDSEALELCRASIDSMLAWTQPYQTLVARVLELASQRRGDMEAILRPRATAGDIDYSKLSREHMIKYPKIRAALAK